MGFKIFIILNVDRGHIERMERVELFMLLVQYGGGHPNLWIKKLKVIYKMILRLTSAMSSRQCLGDDWHLPKYLCVNTRKAGMVMVTVVDISSFLRLPAFD